MRKLLKYDSEFEAGVRYAAPKLRHCCKPLSATSTIFATQPLPKLLWEQSSTTVNRDSDTK